MKRVHWLSDDGYIADDGVLSLDRPLAGLAGKCPRREANRAKAVAKLAHRASHPYPLSVLPALWQAHVATLAPSALLPRVRHNNGMAGPGAYGNGPCLRRLGTPMDRDKLERDGYDQRAARTHSGRPLRP